MNKKIITIILVISLFIIFFNNKKEGYDTKMDNDTTINEGDYNKMEMITNINISINGKNYNVTLEDNETAQTFARNLPKEFKMSELNGNEKYIYIDKSLPTNNSNSKHIVAGDIMLYGSDCLVIFYKSFDTIYSYTKIGHIDNLSDLGNEDITVKFEN